MMDAGVRSTPTPNPSPQGGGEFEHRASLLPPPLRGRVGGGGSTTAVPARGTTTPNP